MPSSLSRALRVFLLILSDQDYPAIMAFTLVTTVVYVLINLVVDLLYPLLNPQVRA